MKKKPILSPIQPRSKEEILAKIKKTVQFQKNMSFIKEKFWPALCEASQNIQDASILLEGFNTQVMQEFLGWMKTVKISELKLHDKLDKDSPKYTENIALIELFQEMNVFNAKELIEGMRGEVQQFILDEMKTRPLTTLKTRWIDEL